MRNLIVVTLFFLVSCSSNEQTEISETQTDSVQRENESAAQMCINETDAIWVSLLAFSNGEYKIMPRNRAGVR